MAGFCPNEGEALIAAMAFGRVLTDHAGDLELGLFTDAAPCWNTATTARRAMPPIWPK